MTTILAVSFSALIFSGELSGHVSRCVALTLFTAPVVGLTLAITSSFSGTIAIPQDRTAPIFALMAGLIVQEMGGKAPIEQIVATVTASIALTTFITGLILYWLGRLKLGNLVRFIPHPVIGGLLAASGWLLSIGSLRVMTGISIHLGTLNQLFQFHAAVHYLPGVALAFCMFGMMRWRPHFLVIPGLALGSIIVFYFVERISGMRMTDIRAEGWLLGPIPHVGLREISTLTSLGDPDWRVVGHQFGSFASIVLTSMISVLVNTQALDLLSPRIIDLNRELRGAGVANLFAGLGGGMVGFQSLSLTRLATSLGARTRMVGILNAIFCLVVFYAGTSAIGYLPKFVLGGLLLFLGLTFLGEWLYDAWFKLPFWDYAVVLSIVVITTTAGYLAGVGFGVITAAILFVVGYSRVKVVAHALTGLDQRSSVDRSITATRVLRKRGREILVLRLQGFLFFGSANSVLAQFRNRAQMKDPLRFIILDFQRVYGLDSSAVVSLVKMKQQAVQASMVLILAQAAPEILRQFEISGLVSAGDNTVRVFPDRDHALEWCENEILASVPSLSRDSKLSLLELIGEAWPDADTAPPELLQFLERIEVEPETVLMKQGEPSRELYFIEEGRITVQMALATGRTIRVRSMGSGTMVGELGLYLGVPRTASVVTETAAVVYRLTNESLGRLEKTNPNLSASFHRFITRLLAERLTDTTRSLQALLD